MKICIASLSKRIIYNDVLQYGMSDFYECLNQYVKNNPQHQYTYYNFSFGKGAKRDNEAIKEADIIIFPAVQEFTYFTQVMHPRDVEKVRVKVRETFPYLENKHMIMLTQDRHVNEELIITKTLENKVKLKSFQTVDEMDFTACLKGLHYHYIKKQPRFPTSKTTDFVYWGSAKTKFANGEKSGDERVSIIKSINKNPEVSSIIIGRWPFKSKEKWIPLKDTLGYLDQSYATLCFNWIDQTALTARYHEAIACDVVPLVWKNYDSTNILVADDWQRCFTIQEFYDKIVEVKKSDYWLNKIKEKFIKKVPTEKQYYIEFENRINDCIKR